MSSGSPVPVDSKSAKKRKAKGETASVSAPGRTATPPVETAAVDTNANGVESPNDSAYIKELTRCAHLPRA